MVDKSDFKVLEEHMPVIMESAIIGYNDLQHFSKGKEMLELCKELYVFDPDGFNTALEKVSRIHIPFLGGNVKMVNSLVINKIASFVNGE